MKKINLFSCEKYKEFKKNIISNYNIRKLIFENIYLWFLSIHKKNKNLKNISIFCYESDLLDLYKSLIIENNNKINIVFIYVKNTNNKTHYNKEYCKRNIIKQFDEHYIYPESDLFVDALFDPFLCRACSSFDYKGLFNYIVANKKYLVSIDAPYGIYSNIFKKNTSFSDETIIFSEKNYLCFTGYRGDYTGKLTFQKTNKLDIMISKYEKLYRADIIATKLEKTKDLIFKKRKISSNKGNHGSLLIIGGDYSMIGASILASIAAYTCGAGLVRIFSSEKKLSYNMINIFYPEIIFNNEIPFKEDKLEKIIKKSTAIVIGQGSINSKIFGKILDVCIAHSNIPILVDGGAINMLKKYKNTNNKNIIITPHPKEASNLISCSVDDIQNNRLFYINKISELLNCNVVLKGYGTITKYIDNEVCDLCLNGNPGMAVAGMGDILSGIIGGFLAQGFSKNDAIKFGVLIHSFSADLCASENGQIGLLPSNLFKYIKNIINNI